MGLSTDAFKGSKLGYKCTRFPACRATHGSNPNGTPMGAPADAETRKARILAHEHFDPLWRSGHMTRPEAYKWMQEAMGLPEHEAHIGLFDLAQCNRLVMEVAVYRAFVSLHPSAKPVKQHL